MTTDSQAHYRPDQPRRRPLRLRGYDYGQAGAYFVTVCTKDRVCCLGDVADGTASLAPAGEIVRQVWDSLRSRFPGTDTGAFVIMPNHVHGIFIVGAQFIAPMTPRSDETPRSYGAPQGAMNRAPTLGEIVRAFKAASTRLIRLDGLTEFAWQRNYYEHVIRNEDELRRIREYIEANPGDWAEDDENPANTVGAQFIAPETAQKHPRPRAR